MNASYDPEVNGYYFSSSVVGDREVAKTIDLGNKHVLVDVDRNGKIVGVEIL